MVFYFKSVRYNEFMTTFTDKVKQVVKAIPLGQTLTYKEVAIKAGSPKAFRQVGSIMKKNFDLNIPCHRVIKSDGSVGNYNRGGAVVKGKILAQEKLLATNENHD